MSAFDGHTFHRRPGTHGALSAALERQDYEEAALRILLGVVRGVEAVGGLAPDAREELLALLAFDGLEGDDDLPLDRDAR
ncbi:MAG: hypothetical protein R3C39_04010 [Dehalococcoidia bacterium]